MRNCGWTVSQTDAGKNDSTKYDTFTQLNLS